MADRPNNRGRKSRKKVCGFCVDKVEHIDYKDIGDRNLRKTSARPHHSN